MRGKIANVKKNNISDVPESRISFQLPVGINKPWSLFGYKREKFKLETPDSAVANQTNVHARNKKK